MIQPWHVLALGFLATVAVVIGLIVFTVVKVSKRR